MAAKFLIGFFIWPDLTIDQQPGTHPGSHQNVIPGAVVSDLPARAVLFSISRINVVL
ncbi:hypothetical protein IB279_16250 [Ensifer sp. ENS06]|uniref:hypothetical protein n=1 Tax=Ensifer sp. ENS06 TaxID=2769276 RepID=UPI001783059E|nr:hypothetical protein [Ensifer sp. ENS06]MBD9624501.1 hypothetical protein [Ensifer sp. ENS06]